MIGVGFINIRVHNLIAVLGQVDKHTRTSQRKSHHYFVVAKLLCLTLFRCCDRGWRQRLESMFDFTCALVLLFSSSSNAFIIRKARPGRKARKAGRPEGRKARAYESESSSATLALQARHDWRTLAWQPVLAH